jgi:hypothetical protein
LVCVCVYSVFVLSCVSVEILRRADHLSNKSVIILIRNINYINTLDT